jgi:hypothetical protein
MNLGYKNSGYESYDIFKAFTQDAHVRQAGNPIDTALHGAKSPMMMATGKSYVSNLPMGQMKSLNVQSFNHVDNLPGMQQSAAATREQVANVAADFQNDVQQVQATMDAAMKQACENLGMDFNQAQQSIKPPYKTGQIEAGSALVADALTPGAVAIYAAMADAYREFRQERGQMSSQKEAELMDEMRVLLSSKNDAENNFVAPAEIQSSFNFAELTHEEMKTLYMPAELQPEGQQIFGMLHTLDNQVIPHLEHAAVHQFDNDGDKLAKALEHGDQAEAAMIVGDDAVAGRIMHSVEDGQNLQTALSATEIEYNSESFFGSLKMPTSETPDVNNGVKDALASYNNEFRMKIDPESSPALNSGAAA